MNEEILNKLNEQEFDESNQKGQVHMITTDINGEPVIVNTHESLEQFEQHFAPRRLKVEAPQNN